MLDSDSYLGKVPANLGTDGSRKMIKPHNTNAEFKLGEINHVADRRPSVTVGR
jgi:hypothetical protein